MQLVHSKSINPLSSAKGGFTLIELLVVIAIIAILAGMLLPAMSKAKAKGQGIMCLNNTKQLMLAWRMYAEDNNDRIPYAYSPPTPGSPSYKMAWTQGILDWNPGNTANWDADSTIKAVLLWPYTGNNLAIYKCPADIYTVRPSSGPFRGQAIQRIRSNSMNAWCGMNEGVHTWFGGKEFRAFLKLSDFIAPGPSMTWVLLDEHPDSMNDGFFVVDMKTYRNVRAASLPDIPASFHNGACGFAFADGHSEIKKWKDRQFIHPVRKAGIQNPSFASGPESQDMLWLWDRSTAKY